MPRKERRTDEGPVPHECITNIDLIKCYCTHGSQMNQIFLIAAMDSYVDWCLKHPDVIREQWARTLINPEAWLEAAAAWKKLSDARVEANKNVQVIVITA